MKTTCIRSVSLATEPIGTRNSQQSVQPDRFHLVGPPLNHARSGKLHAKTAKVTFAINGDLYAQLTAFADYDPFLEYTALTAALTACLYRYTGATSITLGSPLMRTTERTTESDPVVVIVHALHGDLTFGQLLQNTRLSLLDQSEQDTFSVAELLASSNRWLSQYCPAFHISLAMDGLQQTMPEVGNDLSLTLCHRSGQICGQASFSPELYDIDAIERFCQHMLCLLQGGLENAETAISALEILTEPERRRYLLEWNDTAMPYPKDRCIHELFEEQAALAPESIALVYGNQRLTYRELNERSNQLAHYLRGLGVTADVPVGICLNRSLELIISILGVLKAGGAYIPYDPTYPTERLLAMQQEVKLKALLTMERFLDRVSDQEKTVVCLDRTRIAEAIAGMSVEKPPVHPEPTDLCYVVFTSGSTGRPKATGVYHSGWINMMHWFVREFEITAHDRTLVMSSFSFDITQRSIVMPLISGGQLHLVASDAYDPALILQTIQEQQITLLNCAPSTFYPLVDDSKLSQYKSLTSLRCLFLGGEGVSASRLRNWAESEDCQTRIYNLYGTAECSDVSTFYLMEDFERYVATRVPIGKPIYNTQLYVVNEMLRPVPPGVAGELCLAGEGMGKGYINDAALTAKKFVADPFTDVPGRLLYRTGDIACYLPDGNLEFHGRIDHQVKIRGVRIELGEIETVMRQHPRVKEAIVLDRQDAAGNQHLVAYFVLNRQESNFDEELLRQHSRKQLPAYMVPNFFVLLEEMPLGPNGKVERRALPTPDFVRRSRDHAPTAPESPIQATLSALYREALHLSDLGGEDDFFYLGGNSLLAIQTISRINDTFQVQLSADDFFADATISGIAERIQELLDHARQGDAIASQGGSPLICG